MGITNGNGSFATPSKNAGTYTLQSGIYSTQDGYDIKLSQSPGTLTIAQANLTSLKATRPYDGTTKVTASHFTEIKGIGNETLTITGAGADGNLASKNATSSEVSLASVAGLSLADGSNGGLASNYNLNTDNSAITISKKTLSAIAAGTLSASNKTYDGNTNATVAEKEIETGIGSEKLKLSATGTFDNKNAANGKTVTLSNLELANGSGGEASNYTLADSGNQSTATANIDKATVTLSIEAVSKTYDGNTQATLSTSGAGFTGIVSDDNLTVASATGTFDNKNVGSDKTVTISDITLGGTDAGNYTLSTATATTQANITAASISAVTGISALNKIYDGNTHATLTTSGAGFTGIVSGDNLTVANASGTFADKNAGPGKTVTISGITLGGDDAGNYTLSTATATTQAEITPKALTLSAKDQSKQEGSLFAFAGNEFNASGLVDGEAIASATLQSDGAPATAAVGNYTIDIQDALPGTGFVASNYAITYQPGHFAVLKSAAQADENQQRYQHAIQSAILSQPPAGNPTRPGQGYFPEGSPEGRQPANRSLAELLPIPPQGQESTQTFLTLRGSRLTVTQAAPAFSLDGINVILDDEDELDKRLRRSGVRK